MTPYYADDWLTVYQGDCRDVMASMEPESVHCVVTSPPYWGLRDYGTATWSGGADDCDHLPTSARRGVERRSSTLGCGVETITAQESTRLPRESCGRCGATRQDAQLGLEPTPKEYVANMVAVFREVRRVLRADGTVWLNLGDSYAGSGMTGGTASKEGSAKRTERMFHGNRRDTVPELAQKQLVGIPWRVAFALQADGWYLRSDIIWAKPNPMPESVTDRPTKAHEYLFLLTKSARYYYDADAVRQPMVRQWDASNGGSISTGRMVESGGKMQPRPDGSYPLPNPDGANLRSVWIVATQPYPGAHFATFPEKLVEPCVKAGSPPDGTVLDPFGGSGTTARVAQKLGRRAVLIDLNADYLVQAMKRNVDVPLGLNVA